MLPGRLSMNLITEFLIDNEPRVSETLVKAVEGRTIRVMC
jgi:hypothetical protein